MIKISKGLDLPISGSPTNTISDEPKVSSVALLSNDFIGMKPTMLVKEGETVKAGQKIFEDKKLDTINLKDGKELLVPVLDEFIISLHVDDKKLIIADVDGLLDI